MRATPLPPAPSLPDGAAGSDRGARVGTPSSAALQPGTVRWLSKRNCSLAPAQVLACVLPLCLLLAFIGLACWRLGALWVLPFAAIEIGGLGAAVLAYARHAADCETVEWQGERLLVRHCHGRDVDEMEFASAWVRVAAPHDDGALVEVSAHGRHALIGRYVRPEKRPRLAGELRRSLAQHRP